MKLVIAVLSFLFVLKQPTYSYMMMRGGCVHPETKFCNSDFVMKVVVLGSRQVRLYKDGSFVNSDQNGEDGLTIEETIHENNHLSNELINEPEAIPVGPNTNSEGQEIIRPEIQSSNLRSSSLRSGLQGRVNPYSNRGPLGSMPGIKKHFESLNAGSLRLPGGPTPVALSSQGLQNRQKRSLRRKKSPRTPQQPSDDQPEEAPAGSDPGQGVIQSIQSKGESSRRTGYRGPKDARPGHREDFESLKLSHVREKGFPTPIAQIEEVPYQPSNDQPEEAPAGPDPDQGGNQISWGGIQAGNRHTEYRGSDDSRPGHPEDFASLKLSHVREKGFPTPIAQIEEVPRNRQKRLLKKSGPRKIKPVPYQPSNDQPEEAPAGPDPDQGGNQISWGGIQAGNRHTEYRGSDDSRPGHPEDFASLKLSHVREKGFPTPIAQIEEEEHGRDNGGLMTQYSIKVKSVYKGLPTEFLYTPPSDGLGKASLSVNSTYVIMGKYLNSNQLYMLLSDFLMDMSLFGVEEEEDFEINLERRYARHCGQCNITVCLPAHCPQKTNDICIWGNPSVVREASAVHFVCLRKKRHPDVCVWRNFLHPGSHKSINHP